MPRTIVVASIWLLAGGGCSTMADGSVGVAMDGGARRDLAAWVLVFPEVDAGVEEPDPGPSLEPVRRVSLPRALGEDSVVVGVAVGDSGRRFVLEATRGIYELGDGDTATLVWDARAQDVAKGPFLDVAYLGRGMFAVVQENEGFLIDPQSGHVARHFCYVPEGEPLEGGQLPPPGRQVTQAIAVSPPDLLRQGEEPRIVAQPTTFGEGGWPIASHLALFDARTGEDQRWLEFHAWGPGPFFLARGMTFVDDQLVILSDEYGGSRLFQVRFGEETWIVPLRSSWEATPGERRIEGFTYDPFTETLLLIDGTSRELLDFTKEQVLGPWWG